MRTAEEPGRALRIGMVAPPWFQIPPAGYGGIEWLCHWLTEGLVARGHDVTLVGAGHATTAAHYIRTYKNPPSERLGESMPELVHSALATEALGRLDLDIVHDHSIAGPLAASGRRFPTIVTAHGPLDGELGHYLRTCGERISIVAISESQRRQAPDLNWIDTVHNGIPVEEYPFSEVKGDYALFLGRMSPDKGVHLAIETARAAGLPLIIAAKRNEPDEFMYFHSEIEPRLGPDIDFIGAADVPRKKQLLRDARCLLFPIQWEEPFGIVMVEALACGTPVLALNRGSVPEIVVDGVTGFIRDSPDELIDAIADLDSIDPHACREAALERFDVSAMVKGYESVYRRACDR